ncbi:hypothetical protein PtB15_11B63 [Puccinia triticina]|nr:hypothetical protein PtB15_11B63 [Puccinia triticina]
MLPSKEEDDAPAAEPQAAASQMAPPPPQPPPEQPPQQQQQQPPPAEDEQPAKPEHEPSPLPPELTIAIIHNAHDHQDIQATIQHRLATTGFKLIHAIQIHCPPAPPSRALQPGTNTIYLLSRSRAIQACNDLLGPPSLPPRPGSLRFIFGEHTLWAPDRTETVYELIQHSAKRVFKFSRACPPSMATEPAQASKQHPQPSRGDDEPSEVIGLTQPAQEHASIKQPLIRIPHKTSLSTPTHSLAVQQEPTATSFTPAAASQHNTTTTTTTTLQPPPVDSSSCHSSLSSTLASSSQGSSPMSNRRTSSDHSLPQSVSDSARSSKTESPGMIKTHEPSGYVFRARPIPAAVTEPIVTPKMSKAAMLRLGLAWTPPARPVPASQGSTTSTTRTTLAPVASLNPPAVLPRPTKASTLRTNPSTEPPASPQQSAPRLKKTQSQIFENTPGHGFRRANLQTNIASIAAPKTQPRPTKASALRTGPSTGSSPPISTTPANGKIPSHAVRQSVDYFQGVPGHKRLEKIQVDATRRPEIEPRMTKASMLRIAGGAAPPSSATRPPPGSPAFRPPPSKAGAQKLSLDLAASPPPAAPVSAPSAAQHPALPIDLSPPPPAPAAPLAANPRFGSVLIRSKPT